jgi:hypothetical protein
VLLLTLDLLALERTPLLVSVGQWLFWWIGLITLKQSLSLQPRVVFVTERNNQYRSLEIGVSVGLLRITLVVVVKITLGSNLYDCYYNIIASELKN